MSMHGHPIAAAAPKDEVAAKRKAHSGPRPKRSAHVADVRLDALEAFLTERKATSDEDAAELLGLGYGTLHRVRKEGKRRVSEAFISALSQHIPDDVPLQRFFEFTSERRQDAA